MQGYNAAPQVPALFSAILTPHRSLDRRGFGFVMGLFGILSLIPGLAFFLMGAWPVVGFLGLDLVLIFCAFRASYRSGAAYEQVTVTAREVTVRQVSPRGVVSERSLNASRVRLEREHDEDFGLQQLSLVAQEQRLVIARCLAPVEREDFAAALGNAIGEARRAVVR